MTNKEYILGISDTRRDERIRKILSFIKKEYILQIAHDGLTNIIIPARDQARKTTIMAHHDLYPDSPGYNDNSTGVVTLLKLQEHLNERIELVFTDGEECGGCGCDMYLKNSIRPKQAINVDVVGLGDKIFYEKYGKEALTFKIPKHVELYKRIPFSDSHMLYKHGVPNILLLTGEDSKTLINKIFEAQHLGPEDGNLDLISEDVMNSVFKTIVAMIKEC